LGLNGAADHFWHPSNISWDITLSKVYCHSYEIRPWQWTHYDLSNPDLISFTKSPLRLNKYCVSWVSKVISRSIKTLLESFTKWGQRSLSLLSFGFLKLHQVSICHKFFVLFNIIRCIEISKRESERSYLAHPQKSLFFILCKHFYC
jgi:hypothetical protein